MKVRLGCEHGSRDNAKLPRQSSTTGRATSEWRSKISNFLLMAIIVEPLSQLSLLILMMFVDDDDAGLDMGDVNLEPY
ncbi:hypothetical protein Bca101_047278 [Brassica carinata]